MNELMAELTQLRHRLHRQPELSGREENTAALLADFLRTCEPESIHRHLGGHGLAAVFQAPGNRAGPRVMLRAELDALPLPEAPGCPWPSGREQVAHKCGHDGHMAILAGVARRLQQRPLDSGAVILLFQPAEETGAGAAALLKDPNFLALRPDVVFALHNLPGYEPWSILTREGAFAAGSAGIRIRLTGATSHAAYPRQGRSPDRTLAHLVMDLVNLNSDQEHRLALVTVVHARLGEPAFGSTPGEGEILATLRADRVEVLQKLKSRASALAHDLARRDNLLCSVEFCEEFPVTMNHPRAVAAIVQAAEALDLVAEPPEESPLRWSEDFGFLTQWVPGAMFGLGAGLQHPVLHGTEFDFNDDLLWPGVAIMEKLARQYR